MKGSEFIFRGLGSGNGVTEERINQEKKIRLWNLQDSDLP